MSLRTAPPPPPCFYRTTVPRADGPALQLSVLQFYEPLRSASLVPLVMKVLAEGAHSNLTPRSGEPTRAATTPTPDVAFTQRRRRGHSGRSEAGSTSSRSGAHSSRSGGGAEPSAAPSTPVPSTARAASVGTPASGAETRRNKEVAMRELRARGYPLGVCAVALHHAGDDIERAIEWLTQGRGADLLRAYGNAEGAAQAPAQAAAAAPAAAALASLCACSMATCAIVHPAREPPDPRPG